MPPHIESHSHSEWPHPRSKSTGDIKNAEINALCGCLDSPLFRDEVDEQPSKPLSRLERRQSNPDLMGADSKELVTAERGINAAPFMSKIESIIGPESRYYNNEPQSKATTPRLAEPAKPAAVHKVAPTEKVAVVPKTAKAAAAEIQAESARHSTQEVQIKPNNSTATTKYNKSSSRKPIMIRFTHAVSKKSWRLVTYIGEKGKQFMSFMVKSVDPTVTTSEA